VRARARYYRALFPLPALRLPSWTLTPARVLSLLPADWLKINATGHDTALIGFLDGPHGIYSGAISTICRCFPTHTVPCGSCCKFHIKWPLFSAKNTLDAHILVKKR
jgi:hypothetical protein